MQGSFSILVLDVKAALSLHEVNDVLGLISAHSHHKMNKAISILAVVFPIEHVVTVLFEGLQLCKVRRLNCQLHCLTKSGH